MCGWETNHGLIQFPKGNISSENGIIHLPKEEINGVFEDRELNIWISSAWNGIYLLPESAKDIRNFASEDYFGGNRPTALQLIEPGKLLLGFQSGELISFDLNSAESTPHFKGLKGYKIYRIRKSGENEYFAVGSLGFIHLKDEKVTNWIPCSSAKDLIHEEDGTLTLASAGGLHQFPESTAARYSFGLPLNLALPVMPKDGLFEDSSLDTIHELRTYVIHRNLEGDLYGGCPAGVFRVKDTVEYLYENNPQLSGSILDISEGEEGWIWIGTQGMGIKGMKGNEIISIDGQDGLLSNTCKRVVKGKHNEIWVATNNGVSQVLFPEGDMSSPIVSSMDMQDGLLSNDIDDLLWTPESLYIASSGGLSIVPVGAFSPKKEVPPVHLLGFSVNGKDTVIAEHLALTYLQNNIQIRFIGISIKNPKKLKYKYRLKASGEWNFDSKTTVLLPELPPGEYEFEVWAIGEGGIESEQPAKISFEISPAVWQRWWFGWSILLLITAFLAQIIYRRFKNLEMKNQLREKLLQSEAMALRAQMNPHFIFNTLNAIQEFIMNKDALAANLYLSRFATMIRNILNHSAHNFIRLDEEIEFLENYLELEMLRMEDRFQLFIDLGKEVTPSEVYVPTMVIQPFAENAIRHGFSQLESRKATLRIRFDIEGEVLVCSIEDNGIGRAASMRLKAQSEMQHTSMGLQITTDRINLISQSASLTIIDLEDEEGNPLGTKVELRIPQGIEHFEKQENV